MHILKIQYNGMIEMVMAEVTIQLVQQRTSVQIFLELPSVRPKVVTDGVVKTQMEMVGQTSEMLSPTSLLNGEIRMVTNSETTHKDTKEILVQMSVVIHSLTD